MGSTQRVKALLVEEGGSSGNQVFFHCLFLLRVVVVETKRPSVFNLNFLSVFLDFQSNTGICQVNEIGYVSIVL